MKVNTNDNKKQIIHNQANQSESNKRKQILSIYKKFSKNQTHISEPRKELNNLWKMTTIENNKLRENFLNTNDINNNYEIKKIIDYKIESNNELNNFTSKNIQDENNVITRNFQNEANNYMIIDEQVENEKIGIFFKKVAQISRMSYIASLKLLKKMKKKFTESKENKISLSDENFRKEFSLWIKLSEIKNNIFEEYNNILNQEFPSKIVANSNEEKYLIKLFYDLILLYFHCHISFPLVEIDFKAEDNFDSNKMIDFINKGNQRKVNFVILPSLISNGHFLENGKSWVFTYLKDSFRFEEKKIDVLNNILNRKSSNVEINENDYDLKVIWKNKNNVKHVEIITNIGTRRNKRYEFELFGYDKIKDMTFSLFTTLTHLELEKNMEIVKCELRVDDKIILSSKNIIKED